MVRILKRKGIALRTFTFTAALITLTFVISFGVLYFILPDYYYYIKNKNLEENAKLLVERVERNGSKDDIYQDIRQDIIDFSIEHNANILTFADNNGLIVALSTPFSSLYMRSGGFQWSTAAERIEIRKDEADDRRELYTDIIYIDDRVSFMQPSVSTVIQSSTSNERGTAARMFQSSTITLDFKLKHNIISHMVFSGTLQPINEAQAVIVSLAPYLLIVNMLIALIAAYFYSRHMTKPIVTLSDAAAKMRLMTPDVISAIRSNDELGELSENLDLMYASLCANIEDLRQEMEKVSVLEKSKTDFMRAASHELKTPIAALNGIIEGMIDNVGRYKDKEKYLRESKRLIDSLARLISEILYASKMDTAENIIRKELIRLSDPVEAILNDNRLFIEEKGIELSFKGIEAYVMTDPNIFGNALSNVISNAVKYTNDGGLISVEMNQTDDGLILTIENECDYIPDSDLPKLFEPFYTRSYSRNRINSGTGLGLYIVKRNLETLQINYKLENSGSGLRFSFYL